MDLFSLACVKLFNKFPLCQYTNAGRQGMQQLKILILGRGNHLHTLLYQVLTNGQMPHTVLSVTVVSDVAAKMADRFVENAPAAPQFIRITKDGALVTDPDTVLCDLRFRQESFSAERIPLLATISKDYPYVLISSENDAFDQKLADACAAFSGGRARLVAHVQSRDDGFGDGKPPFLQAHSFGPMNDDAYYAETKRLAFNLHYIYEKSVNSRKPLQQIQKSFAEPYNYLSNMEAATHIRIKLACCGINIADLDAAALALNRLLHADPSVLDQLSAMEHNRWLMTKLLQGYRPMPSIDLIYSAPGIGTHDSNAKWHCCIVPCDMTGKSRLEPQDWERPFSACREELDPLDRITLQIHEACKRVSDHNRLGVESALQAITLALTLDAGCSEDTLACKKRLQIAISQLWAEKKSAIPLFERELQALRDQLQREAPPPSRVPQSSLGQIEQLLAPLIEYISRKDYKELDRILVGQLPYALTRKPDLVLAKPLSETLSENIYTTWQLDPKRVVYFAIARSEADLPQLFSCADRIQNFLRRYCEGTQAVFHLIIPQSFAPEQLRIAQDGPYRLHTTADFSLANIQGFIDKMAREFSVDAFDITGADPLIAQAINLQACHSHIGVFYVQKGVFYNLQNAETFEYARPHKALMVSEMFDMTGAVYEQSESKAMTELSDKYPALWEIACSSPCWDSFCTDLSTAHARKKRKFHIFMPSEKGHPDAPISVSGAREAAAALLPALRRLQEIGCIRDLTFTLVPGNRCNICLILPENLGNEEILTPMLQNAMRYFQPDTVFSVGEYKGYPELLSTNLSVRDFAPSNEKKEEYERLLSRLERENLIINHRSDSEKGHSFTFASHEVLTCLQKSGTILERIIYLSALFDGDFDDVEIGWKFLHHTGPLSAENEIDVICTKDLRSLFISAKMIATDQYESKERFILYEILLLAQKFGINATPVLVVSSINQFEERDGKIRLSEYAQRALRRGVYLIGKECIENNTIGQTLSRIIDGCYDPCPAEEPVKTRGEGFKEDVRSEENLTAAGTAKDAGAEAGFFEEAAPAMKAEPADAADDVEPAEPAADPDESAAFIHEIYCGEEAADASDPPSDQDEETVIRITIDDFLRTFTEDEPSPTGSDDFVIEGGLLTRYTGSDCEVVIPREVTEIDEFAFTCCENMREITIPNSVTHIGNCAFTLCNELQVIHFEGTEDQWKAIHMGNGNECLSSASIHFLKSPCKEEAKPAAVKGTEDVVGENGEDESDDDYFQKILDILNKPREQRTAPAGSDSTSPADVYHSSRQAPAVSPASDVKEPSDGHLTSDVGPRKQAPVRVVKIGSNDPCPCGSGLKWKKCTCAQYHEQ